MSRTDTLPPPKPSTRMRGPGRPRRGDGTVPTPRLLRRYAIVSAALAALTAVLGLAFVADAKAGAERIGENTGPVLVAAQSLRASLAEADAAATAAFVSQPDEDPRQRRTYLDAIERVNTQLEQVAARIGDAPVAHDALADLAGGVTRYAGLVEAARATRAIGDPAAEQYLLDAVTLLNGPIADDYARLAEATRVGLEVDLESQGDGLVVIVGLGVAALAVLALAQLTAFRRTRRVVNPGLALATVAMLAAVVWIAAAVTGTNATLAQARDDGYEAIEQTNEVQTRAFASKGAATVAVITGRSGPADEARTALAELYVAPISDETVAAAREGIADASAGLLSDLVDEADSPRERAQAAEALARFDAYRDELEGTFGASSDTAAERVAGPVAVAFNGFTFTTEGILAANRDQFLAGLRDAEDGLAWVDVAALLLPVLAAAAAWRGLKTRIDEYR